MASVAGGVGHRYGRARPAVGCRARGGIGALWLGLGPLMTAAVAAAAWMVAHQAPLITLRGCVSSDGPLAWLGVHLSLLRADSGCGAGQFGLDAGSGHVVGIVAIVAVPTLLLNVCGALGLIGVWIGVRTLLAGAVNAMRRLWPHLPHPPSGAPTWHRPPALPQPGAPRMRAWQLERGPVLRRGPPMPGF